MSMPSAIRARITSSMKNGLPSVRRWIWPRTDSGKLPTRLSISAWQCSCSKGASTSSSTRKLALAAVAALIRAAGSAGSARVVSQKVVGWLWASGSRCSHRAIEDWSTQCQSSMTNEHWLPPCQSFKQLPHAQEDLALHCLSIEELDPLLVVSGQPERH